MPPDTAPPAKEQIRQFIAEGNLDAALPALRLAAQSLAAGNIENEITLLESRLAENRRNARLDTHDPALLSREQNNLSAAALELLLQLPDKAPDEPASLPGISEQTLKQHILVLTIGVKFSVFFWLHLHWQTKGFTNDQFTGVLSMLVPVLAAYTGLMFQDFLDHRHVRTATEHSKLQVRRSVQWTVYAVITAYGMALLAVIGFKARGEISYTQLSAIIAFVESAIGIYLARIVRTFFPDQKPIAS